MTQSYKKNIEKKKRINAAFKKKHIPRFQVNKNIPIQIKVSIIHLITNIGESLRIRKLKGELNNL